MLTLDKKATSGYFLLTCSRGAASCHVNIKLEIISFPAVMMVVVPASPFSPPSFHSLQTMAATFGEQKVWLVQDFCRCCLSGEHSWPGQAAPAGPQPLAPEARQLYKLPSCYQINVNVAESSVLRY